VIAEPLSDGAVKLTLASAFPAVANRFEGASGVDAGVTGLDADDGAESPRLFVATTVKVYEEPFVRPVTVIGDSEADAVKPPGDEVTV
jgi:hypothetical protein